MMFKYTNFTIIAYVFVLQTTNSGLCDRSESRTTYFLRQYPKNTILTKERLLNTIKSETFFQIPENNIEKLVRNSVPVSLNVAFTNESCPAVLCFKNTKLHRPILRRRFFKLCGGCKKEVGSVKKENALEGSRFFQLKSAKVISKRSIAINETSQDPQSIDTLNKEEKKGRNITFRNMSIVAATRSSILEFPDAPPGNLIKFLDFKLEEGYFGVFSDLMGYLQPTSFPLGFLRDVVQNHISIHLIIKAIKIEGRVLIWLFIWLILSLALPCAIIAASCCNRKGLERLHDNYSIASDQYNTKWVKQVTAVMMHILLLFLLGGITLILATNEQISRTATSAPIRIKTMFEDIETFVDNTQMQISSVTTSSMQIAVEAVHRDLEGAEELLGKPLRRALNDETGLERAIQALTDLNSVAADLSLRVSALIKVCNKARNTGESLQGSLLELFKLLTVTRQECLPRDQPLCDTLQTQPFNVSFQVETLLSDSNLQRLQIIGVSENFNRTIEVTRRTFHGLPKRMTLETAASRTEIRSILNKHRNQLYDSVESFEDIMNSLEEKLVLYKNDAYTIIQNVAVNDVWRWISVLGLSVLTFFVWGFLICGAPCGCDTTPKTIPFLQTGLGLTCVLSLIMWLFGAISFLIGGHCHVLICQPLYEDPTYLTLSDLLNTKDILTRSERNFFYHLLKENNSIHVERIFSNCKTNQSAFKTFDLHRLLNIDSLANSNHWLDLQEALKKFPISLNNFEILSPSLQQNLEEFSTLSHINLTTYRINISRSITNKDLSSLSDQMKSIAKHLSDARTANNMEHLAVRTKILVETEYQRLKNIRDDILYQMAALEVFLLPLNKQINQSLTHLKTIQYYIDNEGNEIAKKVYSEYIDEFNQKLQDMYQYINKRIFHDIGNCRPLWDTFEIARSTVCRMMIDPMNGFSFACFLCILLFLGLAPVIIRTVADYKKDSEDSLDSITHRRARDGILINEEGTWATPSPRSSSQEYPSQEILGPVETPWTISRDRMEPTIPFPPRIPEECHVHQPSRIAEAFLKSSRVIEAAKFIRSPMRTSELNSSTAELSKKDPGIPSISGVSRILDTARSIQAQLRSPESPPCASSSSSAGVSTARSLPKTVRNIENARNIKSPLPRLIQAMATKARNRYESLKLIERIDRISPRGWL